jgi:hypothetical protein
MYEFAWERIETLEKSLLGYAQQCGPAAATSQREVPYFFMQISDRWIEIRY